jgi:CheY-like chemotaxis protein
MKYFDQDRRIVLLIDPDARKQRLRATTLRGFEVEVHTAESAERAEPLWKSHPYDLVLVAADQKEDESYLLSARIRLAKPEQRIALLVGPPVYIRELAGAAKLSPQQREARRHKKITTTLPMLRDLEKPAQWQRTIEDVVAHWYSRMAG